MINEMQFNIIDNLESISTVDVYFFYTDSLHMLHVSIFES